MPLNPTFLNLFQKETYLPIFGTHLKYWVRKRSIGFQHLGLEGLTLLLQLSLQVFQHLLQGQLLILQPAQL